MVRKLPATVLLLLCLRIGGQAFAGDSPWYFSGGEIDAAYRYQEQFGRRLRNPVKPSGCYLGQSEILASFQGTEFMAPCRFIIETTGHLKSILEQGAAKYLFPLDMGEADIALPKELWINKYSSVARAKVLAQLLREPKLIAIYHTAEHLISDVKTDENSGVSKRRHTNTAVLGFFDGRPIKIIPSVADLSVQVNLPDYHQVSTLHFLAHRLGEMVFSANGKAIPFDLSFEEDFAVSH